MRILSVTAQRPDSTGSGVYLTELVRAFAANGHEQAVIAGVGAEDVPVLPEGVPCYAVHYGTEALPYPILGMSDQMPYPSTRYRDMTAEMTAQFRQAFGEQIRHAVGEFRPDVIFCHHLYYLTSLVRELCPQSRIYAVSHGTDLRQLHKNPWEREYILREIPKLDGIFALHEAQRQEIAQIFSVPAEQIRVIGTGYNRSVFHPFGERQDHGADPDVRLLYAGKICEKKGVLSLLRAVNKLEPPEHWKLALAGSVGDPEEYARIRKTAETVSPAPVFLGMLSHQKLAEAMNQSDIFVLPSFFEGLPLVLVEAMACGMRVVCTDLPGIRQWLDHEIPGHGVVFVTPPAMQNQDEPDPQSLPAFETALAEAIRQARSADRPDHALVERVSWDGLAERILAIWQGGNRT